MLVIHSICNYKKKWNLIQNSPTAKKVCSPQEGHCEKRCEIQGGGQEMAANGKNFNTDNSGEFGAKSYGENNTNSPELSLLPALAYH